MTHDLLAMAEAATPKTKLVFIANPNNPINPISPTMIPLSTSEALSTSCCRGPCRFVSRFQEEQ